MKNTVKFAVVWQHAPGTGSIEVHHGKPASLTVESAKGNKAKGAEFTLGASGAARLTAQIEDAATHIGAFTTRITVHTAQHSFSFFLRDLNPRSPVWIPDYGVAVLSAGDERSYEEVAAAVKSRGLVSESQKINFEPEETFEAACARNRNQMVPIWLGLSRDMRLFEVGYDSAAGYWGRIQARYPGGLRTWPESDDAPISVNFCLGRGAACSIDITRHIDEGVLPILHSTQRDGDVSYELTSFATLETQPLSAENLRGTDSGASYANSVGNMMTPEEKAEYDKKLIKTEVNECAEETVCVLRCDAVNHASVPRYAFFKAGHPGWLLRDAQPYDNTTGLWPLSTGRVFLINLLNGKPMPQEEMAVLLQPGESVSYTLLVPHQPIPLARAKKLARLDYHQHLEGCRNFWKEKLAAGAQVYVPEAAVSERINAGLLHCDLVAYGLEPEGSVAATIGVYTPIGSESSPIIQFFDSMGWHDLARRCLNFFLDRQREDGFIQNFGGYQLETGPVLWSIGEHYRYTKNDKWIRSIKGKVLKSCDYLIAWRERNKREELRGNGYGLIDGKVADPEDFFHSFMLNGLSYIGLHRAGEMLQNIDPAQSKRLAKEAEEYREDIRTAYLESVGRSPVVPIGDGSWVPSFAPWTESPGPVTLYPEGENWYSHSTVVTRDSMLGAPYLVLGEVFEADELASTLMLRAHQELFLLTNAGFSQPYYCRHDYMHALRGDVKEFLKTFYNQFTALQDRETYTFWEHYFNVSPHKTHEEGWFLMQTRWMLYMEHGDALKLLPLIPRKWLEAGKEIRLQNLASYFGKVSLHVQSHLDTGTIEARVECADKRAPKEILLRLPHPDGRHPIEVQGGEYSPETETVRIPNFRKTANVVLRYS